MTKYGVFLTKLVEVQYVNMVLQVLATLQFVLFEVPRRPFHYICFFEYWSEFNLCIRLTTAMHKQKYS